MDDHTVAMDARLSSHDPSLKDQTLAYDEYQESLKGLKKISLVTDIVTVCDWSLGFCALTWASAVLLGAYIAQLSVWDFYDVSVLLFVQGVRFGMAALVRLVGFYRIPYLARILLRAAQLFVPLWMGGFALLSILPVRIRDKIEDRFIHHLEQTPTPSVVQLNITAAAQIAAVAGHSHVHLPYASFFASLTIFYSLILVNAVILMIGNTVTGCMRKIYVHSHGRKSLRRYHDKLLLESSSWMQAGIDLDYAFKILSTECKRGRTAGSTFKNYADLISFLGMHEKGVEAAETALEADDIYVRQAAAHLVGFWAVWEKVMMEGPQGAELQEDQKLWGKSEGECRQVPLRYQGQLLALLVDAAAGRYGATSSAAAWSLGLLMEGNPEKNKQGMLSVLKRKEKKLVTMLLQRAEDALNAPDEVRKLLMWNSRWHMYALVQLVGRPAWSTGALAERMCELVEMEEDAAQHEREPGTKGGAVHELAKMEERVARLQERVKGEGGLDALYNRLSEEENDVETLKGILRAREQALPRWQLHLKTALFVLLNVAVPLTLGFIVKALIRH